MQKEIHPIQGQILKELLLRQAARFSDIKPRELSSDQFTFHLKQLVDNGIVKKESALYELTAHGKDYANRFDIDSGVAKTERQAKLSVLVIATRRKGTAREYVMQQRLKQPYFGFRGFVTGKIKWGESVLAAAARELEEETGLTGKIREQSVYHEHIYSTSGEPLEDKYFFVCLADNLTGILIPEFKGGKNEWVRGKDLVTGDVFYDISDLVALTKKNAPKFSEKSYVVQKY